MRELWIALAAPLASGPACRDTERSPTETVEVHEPAESSSPTPDGDHGLVDVRAGDEKAIRGRLNRIDADIGGLATSR